MDKKSPLELSLAAYEYLLRANKAVSEYLINVVDLCSTSSATDDLLCASNLMQIFSRINSLNNPARLQHLTPLKPNYQKSNRSSVNAKAYILSIDSCRDDITRRKYSHPASSIQDDHKLCGNFQIFCHFLAYFCIFEFFFQLSIIFRRPTHSFISILQSIRLRPKATAIFLLLLSTKKKSNITFISYTSNSFLIEAIRIASCYKTCFSFVEFSHGIPDKYFIEYLEFLSTTGQFVFEKVHTGYTQLERQFPKLFTTSDHDRQNEILSKPNSHHNLLTPKLETTEQHEISILYLYAPPNVVYNRLNIHLHTLDDRFLSLLNCLLEDHSLPSIKLFLKPHPSSSTYTNFSFSQSRHKIYPIPATTSLDELIEVWSPDGICSLMSSAMLELCWRLNKPAFSPLNIKRYLFGNLVDNPLLFFPGDSLPESIISSFNKFFLSLF